MSGGTSRDSDNEVSVVFPNPDVDKEFAIEHNTKAPEGRHRGTTKEHSAELSDLYNQQTRALTDAIFLGMTTEQWSEYDNRHARILEILRGDGLA
jgi:hypothetical protein